MNKKSDILIYQEKVQKRMKQKILNMSALEQKSLALSGSILEKTALASMGCCMDVLSNDANPEVRKEVVKYVDNYTDFANDPSASVRHAVVIRLKNDFEQNIPEIRLDKKGEPYVINTPKRVLLTEMTGDISTVVAVTAKEILMNLKQKELKEAISVVLNSGGLKEITYLFGNTLENSLNKEMLVNNIEELPVRNINTIDRKAGIDR